MPLYQSFYAILPIIYIPLYQSFYAILIIDWTVEYQNVATASFPPFMLRFPQRIFPSFKKDRGGGQHDRHLLQRSEFESRWYLQFFL